MATKDLTTLANVQAFLGNTVAGDVAEINLLITAASQYVATYCSRIFQSQSYTENYNGTDSDRLVLRNWPIQSIQSLSVDTVPIPAAANAAAAGYMFDQKVIYLTGSQYSDNNVFRFTRGWQNVTVTYSAGYSTIPEDLAQAATEMVADKFKRRQNIGVAARQIAGETISYTQADVPPSALSVIKAYRKLFTT